MSKNSKRFPVEVRERAVRLVFEHRGELGAACGSAGTDCQRRAVGLIAPAAAISGPSRRPQVRASGAQVGKVDLAVALLVVDAAGVRHS